ncbi:MAG: aldehyde dehydrogenase [Oscillospiraceae bacterium]|nr:aldehyde dehydrogenase [Oscillospiraceae bacterium]
MNPVEKIITEQKKYFFSGKTKDINFRADALKRLGSAIKKREGDVLAALMGDLGKSAFEAYVTEVNTTLDEIKFALKNLKNWTGDIRVPTPLTHFPSKCFMHPEPYGAVLIMSPWNYPFMLTLTPLVSAIAAGNCAVIKPSEYSPSTSALLAELIGEIFPQEYIAVVEGGRKANETLLDNKFDYILFTGSVAVGRVVMTAAAKNLTPVTLELGGKNPCIVDGTLDMNLAAKRIVWGKCINSGQVCLSPDYVFVKKGHKQAFTDAFIKAVRKSYGENPIESGDYCRIVNKKHFDRLSGLTEGANIIHGGRRDAETLKIEPTLIDGATWDSQIMKEEIFGPLLPVFEYENLGEAVKEINSHPKPLALYIFTKNKDTEKYILDNTSSGGCSINDTIVHMATTHMPFGGVGDSGMGGYHGKYGFDTFTHYRSVLSKSKLIDLPIRYPPYGDKLKLFKAIFRP